MVYQNLPNVINSIIEVDDGKKLKIIEHIGSGSFSHVYRAEDDHKKSYAIKIVKSGQDVHGLSSEMKTLALLNHSSIQKIYQIGSNDDFQYMVLSFFDGQPLSKFIDERGSLSEDQLIKLMIHISDALIEIHKKNIVHKDLKADNILVDDNLNICIIDFGLSGEKERKESDDVVGSFFFASPEQSRVFKRPIDSRSDLYSLGILAFYCITGQLPFYSESLSEIIDMHAKKTPPTFSSLNVKSSVFIECLVLKLLAKDPDDRYQSSRGLLIDLKQNERWISLEYHREILPYLDNNPFEVFLNFHTDLYGRDRYIEELEGVWSQSESGVRSVLIEGAPGSGKSRMVWDFLGDKIKDKNALVLYTKCQENMHYSFYTIKSMFEFFVSQIDYKSRELILEYLHSVKNISLYNLYHFSPKFFESFKELSSIQDTDQDISETLVYLFKAIFNLHKKNIFFIDDVQWIDNSSRKVLDKIFNDFKDDKIFLCIATSRNDLKSLGSLGHYKSMQEHYCKAHLKVEPLDDKTIDQTISGFLGGHKVDNNIKKWASDKAEGSPFALTEYLRSILNAEGIQFSWNRWFISDKDLYQVEAPDDIVDLIIQRINKLSKGCQEILSICSIDSGIIETETIAAVLNETEDRVCDFISEAVSHNLIQNKGKNKYSFVHDRVIEASSKLMNIESQMSFHRKIGEYLLISRGGEEVYRTAFHLMEGPYRDYPKECFESCYKAAQAASDDNSYVDANYYIQFCMDNSQFFEIKNNFNFYHTALFVKYRVNKSTEALRLSDLALKIGTDDNLKLASLYDIVARIHLANGMASPAVHNSLKGLSAIGYSHENSKLKSILNSFKEIILSAIRKKDKLTHRTPRQIFEDNTIISLNYSLFHGGYYKLDTGYLFQGLLRNVSYLSGKGSLKDVSRLYGTMSLLFFVMGLKKLSSKTLGKAFKIAEDINDPETECEINNYAIVGLDISGQPLEALKKAIESTSEMKRWLKPENMLDSLSVKSQLNYGRGHPLHAINDFNELSKELDYIHEQKGVASTYFNMVKSVILSMLGNFKEASDFYKQKQDIQSALDESPLLRAQVLCNNLYIALFSGDYNAIEDTEKEWDKHLHFSPSACFHHGKYYYIARSHIRLEQCLEYYLNDKDVPKELLEKLKNSSKDLVKCKGKTFFDAHAYYIQAGLYFILNDSLKMELNIIKSKKLADQYEAVWVTAACLRLEAHLLRKCDHHLASQNKYETSFNIAQKYSLEFFCKKIEGEFKELKLDSNLVFESYKNTKSIMNKKGMPSSTLSENIKSIRNEKYLDAILNVSIAASKSNNLEQSMSYALDEVIKTLNAERGFIFVYQNQQESMDIYGRNSHLEDLKHEADSISQSVIEKVKLTRKYMLLQDDSLDNFSGSDSLIVNDIKSVVVVPMILGEHFLGMIYLDSRIIKGVFTHADVAILTALAGHIGVAIEAHYTAKIELERREAIKDLEVTGAVQQLLLPSEDKICNDDYSLQTYFKPAVQSGGDWWWTHERSDGSCVTLVGDVTGHGPGPAMVTAVIAGAYQAVTKMMDHNHLVINAEEILEVFHHCIQRIGSGKYWMSMAMTLFDPHTNTLHFWSAGAPPVIVLRKKGKPQILNAPSSPLGEESFRVGHCGPIQMDLGDKYIIFTDGVYEIEAENYRHMTLGRFKKIVASWDGDVSSEVIYQKILNTIKEHLNGETQNDDITFAVLETKRNNSSMKKAS